MGDGPMTQTSARFPAMLANLNTLLSRYGESMMWLARYMERIENLARLLEVTEAFVRNPDGSPGWDSILEINSDEDRYALLYPLPATEENILAFYITESTNPTSIRAMAHMARENARSARPLISTEMWMQLNVFTQSMMELSTPDIRRNGLSGLCNRLKQDCQTHFGVTEGTLYRDQAWLFYLLGKYLERSDQITRLIDIRYHTLLPGGETFGSQMDLTQWGSVLRSAAAYHAFRRLQPVTTTPANVVGFLLKNEGFPRSLMLNLRQVDSILNALSTHYNLRHQCGPLQERIINLRATLEDQTAEEIISRGLHEYMTYIQDELAALQAEVSAAFWPATPMTPQETVSPA
ncbi:alpha-E domain-containing protein [Gluconobacter sp. Dm-62]|uniref:alpha-E domain-containing protein n=1 Tax=Gluconobacter sp. Dm-62 TaxID=2799804 RepID=UPI0038CF6123